MHPETDELLHNLLKMLADKGEEMKKRKDPILFGVIAGSNKLYFIGDWIDEYCDLRFDDVVKQCTDDFLSENISLDDLTK